MSEKELLNHSGWGAAVQKLEILQGAVLSLDNAG